VTVRGVSEEVPIYTLADVAGGEKER